MNPASKRSPTTPQLACLGFSLVPGIGPRRLTRLLQHFGDPGAAWLASEGQLAQSGLERPLRQRLLELRRELNLERELERINAAGATLCTLLDDNFPEQLRNLTDPPLALYIMGSLLTTDRNALGMVGTRKATAYGRDVAGRLAQDLARQEVTVVSGLAYGIDAAAHRGALKAGGRTVAVLGCGVDVVLPCRSPQAGTRNQSTGRADQRVPDGHPARRPQFPAP